MLIREYADVVTSRLDLIAITPEVLLSEKAGDGRLGELTGCEIAAGWPVENWEPHVFDFLQGLYAVNPGVIAWSRYVALREADGVRRLVGTVGSFSREERPGECEMGWGIVRGYEGRGLATEAATGLLGLIREDARMTSVIAHTFPQLVGSVRVMEKCGFVYEGPGEEEGTVRYRLRLR